MYKIKQSLIPVLIILTALFMTACTLGPSIDKELKLINENIDIPNTNNMYGTITFYLSEDDEKYINSYDLGIENNKAVPIEYIVYDTESSMKMGNIKLWFTEDSVLFYNESMCSNIIKMQSDISTDFDVMTFATLFKENIANTNPSKSNTSLIFDENDNLSISNIKAVGTITNHIYTTDNLVLNYADCFKIEYDYFYDVYHLKYMYEDNILNIAIYQDEEKIADVRMQYQEGYKMPTLKPDTKIVDISEAKFNAINFETDDEGAIQI